MEINLSHKIMHVLTNLFDTFRGPPVMMRIMSTSTSQKMKISLRKVKIFKKMKNLTRVMKKFKQFKKIMSNYKIKLVKIQVKVKNKNYQFRKYS